MGYNAIKGALGAGALGPLGLLFGDEGEEGTSVASQLHSPASLNILNGRDEIKRNKGASDLLNKYSQGGGNLDEIMKQAAAVKYNPNSDKLKSLKEQAAQLRAEGVNNRGAFKKNQGSIRALDAQIEQLGAMPEESIDTNAMSDALATDARTSRMFAKEQLGKDDTHKGVMESFNRNLGAEQKYMDNADADREAMSGKDPSYGLTSGDYQAYGEGSGNLARMFGSQESALAQSLADRGLAAAPSGAAQAGFSGIQGNKFEQLGQLQRQISNDRVNTARDQVNKKAQLNAQLLGQSQKQIGDMGNLSENMTQNQLNAQMGGRQQTQNELAQNTQLNQSQQSLQQNQANEQFAQQQQSATNPLWQSLLPAAGAAAGALVGGPAGGSAGSALGGGLQSGLAKPKAGSSQAARAGFQTPSAGG